MAKKIKLQCFSCKKPFPDREKIHKINNKKVHRIDKKKIHRIDGKPYCTTCKNIMRTMTYIQWNNLEEKDYQGQQYL